MGWYALGSVGAVVHQQKVDVVDVADEEGLVAGGHHVLGLLVGAEADLGSRNTRLATVILGPLNHCHPKNCSSYY